MPCIDCQNWRPKGPTKDARDMARAGFAICILGKPWKYLSAENTCERHKPMDEKQATARKDWLSGSSRRLPATESS